MTSFDTVRDIAENIIRNHIIDVPTLSKVLNGTFRPTAERMEYHQMFEGSMNPDSPFLNCELRIPTSAAATSAMILCDMAADTQTTVEDVTAAYGDHVRFEPPSPRAPEDALSYVSVASSYAELSFGFHASGNRISSIVIDLKMQK